MQAFRSTAPFQCANHDFQLTDLGAQVAVFCCLTSLLFEFLQTAFHAADNIIQTFQIVICRAQAQFGLMATGIQAGNPGGLFKDHTAIDRLSLNHRRYFALRHKVWRTGTGTQIRIQQLHVAGANSFTTDFIIRALFAFDTAHDFDLFQFVELAGGRVCGIIENNGDFRKIAGRALFRAVEDHVFHAARTAAHTLGRCFAHAPAQRLDKVGFAAAVWPDDTCQTRTDIQLCLLDKRLETIQAKLGKLDHIIVQPSPAADGRRSSF